MISVLGAGSWGTALAILLARNGHSTVLWGHDPDHIRTLSKDRCNNRYLPGAAFPANLQLQSDAAAAVQHSRTVLIAVPSHAFKKTLQTFNPYLSQSCKIFWGTKGVDPESGRLLHELVESTLHCRPPVAVISGPTFALEVANNLPTAVTVASPQMEFAKEIADLLHNPRFRVYTAEDMIGVQVGGTVKNVLAIATGVADGLGFGANTRAAIVTRGLTEMIRLGSSMGGKQETFMGLAGLGDLILTCTDNQSRNRRFGIALGKGQSSKDACEQIGQAIEGIAAAREVHRLAQQHKVELPISEQVYRAIYENLSPEEAVNNLLSRSPRSETLQ